MSEIGIALVGTGGVAHMHGRALQTLGSARLVGAFGPTPANVKRFAEAYGIRGYRALDELLADRTVDAVAVLTPPEHHATIAVAALAAGKHVLVEKPIGASVGEIQTMQDAAAKADRVCMPCHNYIYAPAIRRARQHVVDGKLGRLSSLWMVYNQAHDADGGKPGRLLGELMIHHAYVMLFFAGRPQRVTAVAANVHFSDPKADDQAMIVCAYGNGLIANLWGSFAADDPTSDPWSVVYKVLGTDGGVTYSWNEAQFGEAVQPGWDKAAYTDSFAYVHEHFLGQCIGRGEAPLSTLDDAIDAQRIVEAAQAAVADAVTVELDWSA